MTDLTERWKKGKLPSGYYFIICIDEFNHIGIDFYNEETDDWNSVYPMRIQKVLAPVPSYDEYMTMKDCAKKEFEAVEKYTKVRELLKECLAHLTIGKYGTSVTPINILCDEVEEALK